MTKTFEHCKMDLQNLIDIQSTKGTWDHDPYMHGLANGLIMAMSVLNEKEPTFHSAPDTYLCDLPQTSEDETGPESVKS